MSTITAKEFVALSKGAHWAYVLAGHLWELRGRGANQHLYRPSDCWMFEKLTNCTFRKEGQTIVVTTKDNCILTLTRLVVSDPTPTKLS